MGSSPLKISKIERERSHRAASPTTSSVTLGCSAHTALWVDLPQRRIRDMPGRPSAPHPRSRPKSEPLLEESCFPTCLHHSWLPLLVVRHCVSSLTGGTDNPALGYPRTYAPSSSGRRRKTRRSRTMSSRHSRARRNGLSTDLPRGLTHDVGSLPIRTREGDGGAGGDSALETTDHPPHRRSHPDHSGPVRACMNV